MADAVLTSRPSAGGGAGSFKALGSPPNAEDETAQLFGEVKTDTRPDILYLLDDDVANSGSLGAVGDGTATGITYASALGGDFNNAAVFNAATDAIAVGGANAPFKLSANDGRADFELVFRFRFDAVDKVYSLLSTDAATNEVTGSYSVLVNTASDSKITFEYALNSTLNSLVFDTGGTLAINTDYHLVLAFKADANSFAGDATGAGVLRCFLDGAALADNANGSNKFIAISAGASTGIVDVGRISGGANHKLSLGLYLDGTSSLPATGDALYQFAGNMDDGLASADGSESATSNYSRSPHLGARYITDDPLGGSSFGEQLRVSNNTNESTNWAAANFVTIPNPGVGSGAFTVSFWCKSALVENYSPFFSSHHGSGNPIHTTIALRSMTSGNLELVVYDGNVFAGVVYNFSTSYTPPGTWEHFVLVRHADGVTWNLYINGTQQTELTTGSFSLSAADWLIGALKYEPHSTWTPKIYAHREGYFDDFYIVKSALYSPGSPPITPTGPTSGTAYADRSFAGKMDEFSVLNKRCPHDTSTDFQVPATPTRTAALTIVKGMDSEGNHGQVVTTKNAGEIIPNTLEALPAGSLYSDGGTVKIVQ